MDIADGLGKPKTIIIDGKEYSLKDLDIDDMAEIQRYIQRERIKTWYQVATEMKLEPSERDRQLKVIMKSSVSGDELIEFLDTLEGARLYFYFVLRHNEGVTLENIHTLIRADNLAQAQSMISNEVTQENPPMPVAGAEQ